MSDDNLRGMQYPKYEPMPKFPEQGMQLPVSLRDYFAAKAMQGIIAAQASLHNDEGWEWTAQASYKQADAMLAAREVKS